MSAPSPTPPPVSRRQRLRLCLLGTDPALRQRTQRLSRLLWLSLFSTVLLALGWIADLVPAWSALTVSGVVAFNALALYGMVRSGRCAHWSDSSVAFVQVMASITAVAVTYGLVDLARGAALQLLCLLLAFEMDRLSTRQLWRASLTAVALLCASSLIGLRLAPDGALVGTELYKLLMAAVLLPVAIMVGGEIGRLYRRQIRQREALSETLTRMQELSTRDALTALCNRRHAEHLLQDEIQRRQRGEPPFAVALLDIDHFKQVNDLHGHAVGDAVLRQFAAIALSCLRPMDTVARWGGEEFLLLMPRCDRDQALQVVARLHQQMRAFDWGLLAPGLQLRFSAGIAPHHANLPLKDLLLGADVALYRAKAAGRDRSVVASEPACPAGVSASSAQALRDGMDRPETARASASASSSATAPAPDWIQQTGWSKSPLQRNGRWDPEDGVEQTPPPSPGPSAVGQGRPATALRRLSDLVMSSDPQRREHLRLPVIASGLHLIWIGVVIFFAMPGGLINPSAGWAVAVYESLCMAGFYLAIRSGWSSRFKDPSLVMPQMLAALMVVCCVYPFMGAQMRPSLLHLICVIQVFGMATLTPQASRLTGVSAMALLVGVWLSLVLMAAPNLIAETLTLAFTLYVVSRLSVLSHRHSLLRLEVEIQQQELAVAVETVQELVIRDALTGLFNRQYMQDLLQREGERLGRTGHRFCVAMIDVDHFKRVNDEHGHQTGDEVLRALAEAARQALRETDVICRWGGEEFLVLMRDTHPSVQGLQALSRLRDKLGSLQPAGKVPGLTVTFSAGLAQARTGETLDGLIERADRALYRAKASGRNRDAWETDNPGATAGPPMARPDAVADAANKPASQPAKEVQPGNRSGTRPSGL